MQIVCPQCKCSAEIEDNAVRRAQKAGLNIYCSRACSGLARRVPRTVAEKKKRKRDYDILYRAKNLEAIRRKKAEHYQRTVDRDKEREVRKKRMPLHVEYCRQPKYKAYKRDYDMQFRAKKLYGEFADVALILRDVEVEIDKRMTWVERHQANGTLNKSTQRKRQYAIQTGTQYPR